MSDLSKAIFLSYAREDSAAVHRIAEALRSAAVEVWFDQDELTGGDQWDQKIRGQIGACALFIPVISANTQARQEGYFRLEWKLAEDRSHLMVKGKPFIVPVSIDATSERGALVPDAFRAVQWTKLLGGETTSAFITRVQKLLGAPSAAALNEPLPPPTPVASVAPAKSGRFPLWASAALIAAVLSLAGYFVLRPAGKESAVSPNVVAETKHAATTLPAHGVPVVSAKSVAVLPFENLSADPENEFFAGGIHGDLITALTKVRDIKVIHRASVLGYKPGSRDLKRISQELDVAHFLEGSVQRAGNKVRVNVQLVNPQASAPLWAHTYTEELTDVFSIQTKLVTDIASKLRTQLSPAEKSGIERRPTQNLEAFALYTRARELYDSFGDAGERSTIERVIVLCEQAVAADPSFVEAYLMLCQSHGRLFWYGYLDPSPARREKVKAARDAAIRLAPNLPETRLAMGVYAYRCDHDWAEALTHFTAAGAGLPNDAEVADSTGLAQRRLGRFAESLASFKRAGALNPRDVSVAAQQLAMISAFRHYQEAKRLALSYGSSFVDERFFMERLAVIELQLTRDRSAYVRRMEKMGPESDDPHGLILTYRLALARGDLESAGRTLTDPRVTTIFDRSAVAGQPVTLHQGLVDWARGRLDSARMRGEESLRWYASRSWMPRQRGFVQQGTALAHALAGRESDAIRATEEGLRGELARDAWAGQQMRREVMRVYLVLGRVDDALRHLRDMMNAPGMAAEEVRFEFAWSKLHEDPRFESILASAKSF